MLGGTGSDTLDGGADTDTADYSEAPAGVTVDLRIVGTQTVGGGQGTDTLIAIENVTGSDFKDRLDGNSGVNAFTGGGGNDKLNGGIGNDVIIGGAGKDTMDGGKDADIFAFASASDSTGKFFDKVQNFDFTADRFDLPDAVSAIDATIETGKLSRSGIDAKLALVADAAHLGAHHAVLFTPDTGNLAGKLFLLVDVNGVAGYQAGEDLVIINLIAPTNLASIDTGDFF